MTDVTKNIVQFRDFPAHAWPYLDSLTSVDDWENDIDFIDAMTLYLISRSAIEAYDQKKPTSKRRATQWT